MEEKSSPRLPSPSTTLRHQMDPTDHLALPRGGKEHGSSSDGQTPATSEYGDSDPEKAGSPTDPSQPDQPPAKDPNLIEWDGPDDPENPQNWTRRKKWIVTVSSAFMTFNITFASSVFSTATLETAKLFHVSPEVMILGTSLFVLGFAVGPMIWGPLSELYGRRIPLFSAFLVFIIFNIAVATSQTIYSVMLCRFFGGLFGSAPLAIIGGLLADIWGPVDRGSAVAVFASAVFIGPVAGPIAGGFIVMNENLGWRWTSWMTAILASFFWLIGLVLVPETYAPKLLQSKAREIRLRTRNWAIHSKADESPVDIKAIVEKYMFRPIFMFIHEPILVLITVYLALIYGILYLFFEAYPVSFQEGRGWNPGVGALPFIGITIGVLLGAAFIIYMTQTRFASKLKKAGYVVPEERLPPAFVGAAVLPLGLFWFGWTSSPHITWVPQVIAGVPIGFGILVIFMQCINYLIDVYLMHANSAIAINTLFRSLAGAGFPLFATAMFRNLGVPWASSLLAFLTLAMFPIPILFFFYGAKIREMSKFSPK